MSYSKQNFVSGGTLYASQLNSMDNQIKTSADDIGTATETITYINTGVDKNSSGAYTRSGSFFSSSSYANYLIHCNPGDVFKVTSKCVGSIVLAVYFSGEPSTTTRIGAFSGELSVETQYTDELVTAPDECYYIAFGGKNLETFVVSKQKVTVSYTDGIKKNIAEISSRIDSVIGTKTEHSAYYSVKESIQDGVCYSLNAKSGWQSSSYRSVVCDCEPGDKFKVSGCANGAIILAIYYNGTPSNSTYVGKFSDELSGTQKYTDEIITIPEGCTKVAFNDYKWIDPALSVKKLKTWFEYSDGLYKDVEDSVSVSTNAFVEYSISNDTIMIRQHYTATDDAVIVMNRGRGNNLFDFYKLGTIPASEKMEDFSPDDLTQIWSSGTDWHAPFKIAAVDNVDGDNPTSDTFTGGNHQYNNQGSGSTATASSKYVKFFADGKPVTSGSGYARKLTVEWKNGVQAYNTRKSDGTGREVLTETHTAVFDGYKFSETVRLAALEELTMELWYGFQFSNRGSVYSNVVYIGGANRVPTTDDESSSGNNKPNGILAYGDNHAIEIEIDTGYDLGKRDNYSGTSGAFTANGKGYFNTATYLNMASGAVYSMRGSYRFYHI